MGTEARPGANPGADIMGQFFGPGASKAIIERTAPAAQTTDQNNPPAGQAAPAANAQGGSAAAAAAPKPAAETVPDKNKVTPKEEDSISDFVDLKPAATSPKEYKTTEEFIAEVKKELGIDNLPAVISSAKKWRQDSTKLPDAETKYNNLSKAFGEMPDEIKKAGLMALKGEDYRSYLKGTISGLDYSIPVEKQEMNTLVKEFAPEINIEDPQAANYVDITDTKNPAVTAIKNAVQKNYTARQIAIDSERTRIAKTQEVEAKSVIDSISSTMTSFQTAHPKIEKQKVEHINSILNADDVEGELLRDKNGKYLPDAAERVYLATHGATEIQKILKAYEQLRVEYNELLGKGTDKPASRGGNREPIQNNPTGAAADIQKQFFQPKGNPYVMTELVS